MKSNMKVHLIASVIAITYLFGGLFVLKDYGLTTDDDSDLGIGHKYLYFYGTGHLDFNDNIPQFDGHPNFYATSDILRKYPYYFYPFEDILSAGSCYIFFQKFHVLDSITAHHLIIPLLTAFFLYVMILFTSRYWGWLAGLTAGLALITYPRFFGDSFNNIKDIPELIFFSITVFLFVQWYFSKKIKYLYLAFIYFGFSFITRVDAILIPVILFLWVMPEIYNGIKTKKKAGSMQLKHFLAGIAVSIITILILHPGLQPWAYTGGNKIADAFKFFMNMMSFTYKIGMNDSIKWNLYAPLQILSVTPAAMLVLFVLGLIRVIGKIKTNKVNLLLLVWLVVPVARHSFPHMQHYFGIRHFLVFLVPFVIIVSQGVSYIAFILSSKLIKVNLAVLQVSLCMLFLIPNLYSIVTYHPYQTMYFNELAGGLRGAQEKNLQYCYDYFHNSYRKAGEWINQNAVENAYYYGAHHFTLLQHYITRKDLKGIFTEEIPKIPPPRTYIVALSCDKIHSDLKDLFKTVYRVKRNNAEIFTIYFIPEELAEATVFYNKGSFSMQQKDFDGAVSHFNNCIKIYPEYYPAHNNLGAVYFLKGNYSLAMKEFETVLELKPDFEEARRNMEGLKKYLARKK